MKSLNAQGHQLSNVLYQLQILENRPTGIVPTKKFEQSLEQNGLYPLKPANLEILQINLGKMCNQTCAHCHVDAGPDRKEIMSLKMMEHCIEALIKTPSIHTVDLTGGAPEMNPNFRWFVEEISKLNRKIMVRSNLTILVSNLQFSEYPEFFVKHKLTVIASLPCYTAENTDKQRGDGVFQKSIEALRTLNRLGYGQEGSGLELHLVYNPVGPSLPPDQEKLELDYKRILQEQFDIVFNNLYTITNMPISRFLDYLLQAGKYEMYMEKLIHAFNPSAAAGVMCRNTISVGWDGTLYDCDFNQMLDLSFTNGSPRHIRDFNVEALNGRDIIIGQHCYGCTAGAGSSCQGSIV
ncbi:arsenosugar biosynthesis radical SAM protein ArsS [bacterium]|nr:arsenosugar biosynthesis radical SAM protein ArsS [bacterium]